MASREHDDPGDQEGEEGRHDRGDEPAGALVEGERGGDARGVVAAVPLLLGALLRLDSVGVARRVGHAATSWRRPPVIAIPSCSSVTPGPYAPTIRPS